MVNAGQHWSVLVNGGNGKKLDSTRCPVKFKQSLTAQGVQSGDLRRMFAEVESPRLGALIPCEK